MGVDFVGATVGGPAGVAEPDGASEFLTPERIFELAELPGASVDPDLAVFEGGDAGGVVAAIFEPLEPVHQDRHRGATAYVTDDSAHVVGKPFGRRGFDPFCRVTTRSLGSSTE